MSKICWRKFSGQDKNSVFTAPKWIDPVAGRFDVAEDSPNLLPDGKVIGALGYLGRTPNMPPEIVVTAPGSGAESAGATALAADASDHDGTVSRVEFYTGEKLPGQATVPPYRLMGVKLPTGRHTLKAKAIDDRGMGRMKCP